jgi:putative ABC transport system ATP-binding protein
MKMIVKAHKLSKHYDYKKTRIQALGPIDFEIEAGSFNVILGRSGSGKSTLLNLLAGLDRASGGELEIYDENISGHSQKRLAKYRSKIGIIFQFYNLFPNLNCLENVLISSQLKGLKPNKEKAIKLLKEFGLGDRIYNNIKTLSGGEKQRVAICRSLISDPEILFCDEPTGALDSINENAVKDILIDLNKKGMTIIMVTHNDEFANLADRVITLKDGQIESDIKHQSDRHLHKKPLFSTKKTK